MRKRDGHNFKAIQTLMLAVQLPWKQTKAKSKNIHADIQAKQSKSKRYLVGNGFQTMKGTYS
eukprot:3425115-Amphidinium_carterae.1